MRILYVAPDQPIPGTQGGSVHVASVADGLAARGHDVHVLASPGEGAFPSGAVHWYDARPPMGIQKFRLLRSAGTDLAVSSRSPRLGGFRGMQ